MTGKQAAKRLRALGACGDAVKFVSQYRTFRSAWLHNKNARWADWLLAVLFPDGFSIDICQISQFCRKCGWNETVRLRPIEEIRKEVKQQVAWDEIEARLHMSRSQLATFR